MDKLSNAEEAELIWKSFNLPCDSPASYFETRFTESAAFRNEFMQMWQNAERELYPIAVVGILEIDLRKEDKPAGIYFTDVFSFIQKEAKTFKQSSLDCITALWRNISCCGPLPPVCVVVYYPSNRKDSFVSQMSLVKSV